MHTGVQLYTEKRLGVCQVSWETYDNVLIVDFLLLLCDYLKILQKTGILQSEHFSILLSTPLWQKCPHLIM
jgi:hypothetical protein